MTRENKGKTNQEDRSGGSDTREYERQKEKQHESFNSVSAFQVRLMHMAYEGIPVSLDIFFFHLAWQARILFLMATFGMAAIRLFA
jgi:hypothetical protein